MFICMWIFNYAFFGIQKIWFLKIRSIGAHVPKTLFVKPSAIKGNWMFFEYASFFLNQTLQTLTEFIEKHSNKIYRLKSISLSLSSSDWQKRLFLCSYPSKTLFASKSWFIYICTKENQWFPYNPLGDLPILPSSLLVVRLMLLWDFLLFDLAKASTTADVPATPGPGKHCLHLCNAYWIPPPYQQYKTYTLTIICLGPVEDSMSIIFLQKIICFSIMQTEQEASLKFDVASQSAKRRALIMNLHHCIAD
jgi:hypothetical protein